MKTLSRFLLIAFLTAGLAACDSNPINEDDSEHTHLLSDVERLALTMNGEEVVVVSDNQLDSTAAENHIHLHAGESTPLITLEATDENGEHIHLDEIGSEYYLDAEFGDFEGEPGHDHDDDHDHDHDNDDDHDHDHDHEGIAAFEQHDEDGRWAFHIRGEQAGTTYVRLRLMHNDHADLVTPGIEVTVEDDHDHSDDHDHNH